MLPDEMMAHRLGLVPLWSEDMERKVVNYNRVSSARAVRRESPASERAKGSSRRQSSSCE